MRERTPGIDIKTVTLEGDAEFSVWDYAGQVEYYLVRRLVLT
jgi:GTPase SAR1 family protein